MSLHIFFRIRRVDGVVQKKRKLGFFGEIYCGRIVSKNASNNFIIELFSNFYEFFTFSNSYFHPVLKSSGLPSFYKQCYLDQDLIISYISPNFLSLYRQE